MLRVYLSKVIGDGATERTAYRAAFRDLLPGKHGHGVIDSRKYMFSINEIDTNDLEHQLLVASPDVRYLSTAILALTKAELSAGQRTTLQNVITWLGVSPRTMGAVFGDQATVRDILTWIVGKACWAALPGFDE